MDQQSHELPAGYDDLPSLADKRATLTRLVEQAFSAQATLNVRLTPDWQKQEWPYYRAVWTEIAEAVGHTNWYWWKTGAYGKPMSDTQHEQLVLELADILHFGLSMDVIEAYDSEHADAALLTKAKSYVYAFVDATDDDSTVVSSLEAVVVDAIILRSFNIQKFARACKAIGLSLPGLLTAYFSKGVLNRFRWDHGYNDKTYVKHWQIGSLPAREDNEFLAQIIVKLQQTIPEDELIASLSAGTVAEEVYRALDELYKQRVVPLRTSI